MARPTRATDAGIGLDDSEVGEDAPDAPVTANPVVRAIEIAGGQISGAPHVDFPLLIALSEPWLRDMAHGGDVARSDGLDIYFTADQTARLESEVESYDGITGRIVAWVKVPSLTASTVLYLHYGDPTSTSTSTASAVWSGYDLVLHLDNTIEDATAKSTVFTDMTSGVVAAKFGGGRTFDGVDDAIVAGSAAAIDDVFTGGGTAEAWFLADSYGEMAFGRFFDKGHVAGWSFAVNNMTATGSFSFVHGSNASSFGEWVGPSSAVGLGAWHHAAVVFNRDANTTNPMVYIDGVASATNELVSPVGASDSDASFDLYIGNREAGDRAFDGALDELRLSPQPRSSGWVVTQFRNQSSPSSFYTVLAPM